MKVYNARLPVPPTTAGLLNRRSALHCGLSALAALAVVTPFAAKAQAIQELSWDELVPTGWKPSPQLQVLASRLSSLIDDSPAAKSYMTALRKEWDNAPTRNDLDGKRIKIPGFVVAIDTDVGRKSSFLLVPYYGACVHSPPPPANQIIHVRPTKPVDFPTMETVWVQGTIRAHRSTNGESVTGYEVEQASVELYRD